MRSKSVGVEVESGFEEDSGSRAHFGKDVPSHIEVRVVSRDYEVSRKHFEGNLHRICAGFNRSTMIIGAPQRGHKRVDDVEVISIERSTGGIASNFRQRSRDSVR